MYGLIARIRCLPGRRDELAAVLMQGTTAMPGCRSYVVATDPVEPDSLWVTEVWDSPESHKASFQLPAVQAAMAKGKPLIAGLAERFQTNPVGGTGVGP